MRGKRGPGAPTTPTMPHRRGTGNYSSREAARRGPPTPRGLQSHVQASLVNSARARAASRRAAANVPESAAGSAGLPGPTHSRTPSRARPPTPQQPRSLQTHHPAPRSSPPPAPRAAAWLHCSRPHRGPTRGPGPPNSLGGGHPETAKKEGEEGSRRGRGEEEARGGKPPAPSMAGTAAEPRGSVCNLQTSRLARLQRTKVTGAAWGPHVPGEEGPPAAQARRAEL